MRPLATLTLFLLLSFVPGRVHADPATLDPCAWASVRIDVRTPTGTHGGSGTLVRHGGSVVVLTCRHVVAARGSITVQFRGGRVVPAEFLAADSHADLAALTLPGFTTRRALPVAVADDELVPGVPVLQVGCPGCFRPRVLCHRIGVRLDVDARVKDTGVAVMVLRFGDAPIVSGDSGSGLFAGGELVGVVWGGSSERAVATGVGDVRRFLAGLPK